MFGKRNLIAAILILIYSSILLYYCSDDKKSPTGGSPDDISGNWIAEETIYEDGDTADPIVRFEIFAIVHSENVLEIEIVGTDNSFTGTISGNKINWSTDITEQDGITSISFEGTVSSDGLSISGSAGWTWVNTEDSESSSGTTEVSANKLLESAYDVSGLWNGSWASTTYQLSDNFTVNIVQNSSILTGSIDVPYIGLHSAVLKGAISGSNITFGDIEDIITFKGIIESDSISASGTYSFPGYNDEGSWQASISGSTGSNTITIINSFQVSDMAKPDITFDGDNIWIHKYDQLLQYSTSGDLLISALYPGSYPQGLTYNGTDLLFADGAWGTSTIYKLDINGGSVFNSPGSGQINGLDHDGSYLWAMDEGSEYPRIYKINSDGVAVDSINCFGEMVGGLACEGDDFWYAARYMGETKIYKVNESGDIIKSINTEDFFPGKVAHDGTHLWYYSAGSANQLDTAGSVLSSFIIPNQYAYDIAYGGGNFWFVTGETSADSSIVYKLSATGEILSTMAGFGVYPDGLAFDGTYLRIADNYSHKIYRLNPAEDNFYPIPNEDFDLLTYDGTSFWASSTMGGQIIHFDLNGNIINSFTASFEQSGGIVAVDGSVWVIGKTFLAFDKLYQYDYSGNLLAEYSPAVSFAEPKGLTHDGEYFWYLGYDFNDDTNNLYQLELSK
ncbi:MAG: hypothetical protein JW956_08595 [Calditrichaceae bacterium]|nr:hypothetical protein [Calditrichaceae bacterium]